MNPWNKKVVFILLSVLLWTTISAVGILNAAFLMLSGNSHVNGKVKWTNFLLRVNGKVKWTNFLAEQSGRIFIRINIRPVSCKRGLTRSLLSWDFGVVSSCQFFFRHHKLPLLRNYSVLRITIYWSTSCMLQHVRHTNTVNVVFSMPFKKSLCMFLDILSFLKIIC